MSFQAVEAGLARYFAMARGVPGAPALDMQKYFDTNYHYLVPELESPLQIKPDWSALLAKVRRGQAIVGVAAAVPILLGPVTLVALSRLPEGADAASLVSELVPAYVDLLTQLRELGVPEVQVSRGKRKGGVRELETSSACINLESCLAIVLSCMFNGVDARIVGGCGEKWGGSATLGWCAVAFCAVRDLVANLGDWLTGKALPNGRRTRFESLITSVLQFWDSQLAVQGVWAEVCSKGGRE